jgi:poly(3-hydroxybutyrate) depolymerase
LPIIEEQTMASHALVFYLLDRPRTTSWSRLLLAHGPPPCYDYGWQSDNEPAEGVIMRHWKRSAAMAVVLGAAVLVQIVPAMADEPAHQKACGLERTIKITMKYLLYLPKDYDQKASWPLMLFLHGSGERGDDLNAVKKHGPPKLIEEGKEFPLIVISPQCPNGRWWEPMELTSLLDEIVAEYTVDQDRIYVTGLSMGGFGTWTLAAFQPNRFAALVPICGGGEVYWCESLAHIPVWVFHGAKDTRVPLERSKTMVEALKSKGGSPKFTVYPEAGHDSWTEAYNDPQLYEWLLQQKRTPRTPEAPKK